MDLLVSEMTTLMVTHVTFGSEALSATLGTRERSFIDMNSLVDAKILFFAEGFTTAWECTLVRLSPIVQMQMCVEP